MQENQRKEVLQILEKNYPEAKTALHFSTPFELLVATILSAQSTDKQVNKITKDLFKKYKTPADFAKLKPQELEKEIRGVGLYHNKSKNIIATSKMLQEKYNGEVPADFDALIKLPGVGRKTANVVISNAFGKDAIAVDTHVHRVANRIGLANAKHPEKTEEHLHKNIPKEKWSAAHHWLIYHGRQVCKARKPDCEKCNLGHLCLHYKKISIKEGTK